ncbi:MAG: dihydrofolate reductase family protein [Hyphomonadaceae bacterium]
MPTISSFISLSLDGCYADTDSDMSWAHSQDREQQAFTNSNAKGGGRLIFGHATYDMMASFWPTPAAAQMMPEVAKGMNAMPKVVFSRKMKSADWNNTTVQPDLIAGVRKLKKDGGPDMAILGSGSIVAQLIEAGLLDELQVMLIPVSLGGGKKLFDGVKRPVSWQTTETRAFKGNGNTFIRYRPA